MGLLRNRDGRLNWGWIALVSFATAIAGYVAVLAGPLNGMIAFVILFGAIELLGWFGVLKWATLARDSQRVDGSHR